MTAKAAGALLLRGFRCVGRAAQTLLAGIGRVVLWFALAACYVAIAHAAWVVASDFLRALCGRDRDDW